MKLVTIRNFKEKHQERITFVRVLIEFQKGLGLKSAKELLDNMLDGKPIQYQIPENKLDEFIEEMDLLKLEYKIS
jgi:DNA-binding transcriptional MerR regulator